MSPVPTSAVVHSIVDQAEFWIMAPPEADTARAIEAAGMGGFTVLSRSWYDPEHGWDVLVFTRG